MQKTILHKIILTTCIFCGPTHSAFALGKHDTNALLVYSRSTEVIDEFQKGIKVTLSVDVASPNSISNSFCEKYDWIIPVGKDAIEQVLNQCGSNKIMIVETRFNVNKYMRIRPGTNIHGVYINQSPRKVIEDLSRRVPSLKSIGVAVSSEQEKSDLMRALSGTPIRIRYAVIGPGDNPSIALNAMLSGVDGLLVDDNEEIWRPGFIKAFLLASVRRGKVLVGGVNPQFIRAGVFAGSYTDMKALGTLVAAAILSEQPIEAIAIAQAPSNFSYNELLAKRLDIAIMP